MIDELEGGSPRAVPPPFVLTVNVGTSSARAKLFDAAGCEVEWNAGARRARISPCLAQKKLRIRFVAVSGMTAKIKRPQRESRGL